MKTMLGGRSAACARAAAEAARKWRRFMGTTRVYVRARRGSKVAQSSIEVQEGSEGAEDVGDAGLDGVAGWRVGCGRSGGGGRGGGGGFGGRIRLGESGGRGFGGLFGVFLRLREASGRVFVFGIRFVWQIGKIVGRRGLALAEEVVEGALVHAMVAGLVAIDEVEAGGGGGGGVGAGDGGEGASGGVVGGGAVDEGGLDGPAAADAPLADDHLLDVAELDGVAGVVAGDEVVEEGAEGGGGLVLEDDGAGEEAVADGVRGGTLFALRGDGAAGAGAIGAGCIDSAK
jgi:hypothetical protein